MARRPRRRDDRQTPLGREFAQLTDWTRDDPALSTFTGRRTIPAAELAVWTASIPRGSRRRFEFPLGPPGVAPNPVVVDDTVVCSTFSPGRVLAFDRDTGAPRWTRPLRYYGHHPTPGPRGSALVYCGTSQELLAIRLADGAVAWRFCPYGPRGETIYSSPAVAGDRLFVGDRTGYLHCLCSETGEPFWRTLTSRARNNDVNSTPVVVDGVVVVATNARLAAGYDPATGRAVWRQRLDGPCHSVYRAARAGVFLWTPRSAYRLTADGTVQARWSRRNHDVYTGCAAGDRVLVATRRAWGPNREPWPVSELRAYRDDSVVYSFTYPRAAMVTMRYEPATGRVYESTSYGLGILDPRTGEREAVIQFEGEYGGAQVGQPAVRDGRLYLMDEVGRVHALRHPA